MVPPFKGLTNFVVYFTSVFAMIILMFIGYLLIDFWYNRLTFVPIATSISEEYKNDLVAPQGGKISFAFNSIRSMDYSKCRIEIDRYIKNDTGFEYFITSFVRQPITTASGLTFVTFEIPVFMEPGKYYFQSRGRYFCAQLDAILGPEVSYSPKVYFNVVPQKTLMIEPAEWTRRGISVAPEPSKPTGAPQMGPP